MLGREISCPLDIMVGIPPENPRKLCPSMYVKWLEIAMNNAFEFAHDNLCIAAQRQKQYYDKGLKPREYEPGDWVWRWYLPAISNKLGQGWTGPYLVIKRISDVTYEIQLNSEKNPIVVHVDHLKPFQGRQPPINWLEEVESFQADEENLSETSSSQISDDSLVQPVHNSPVKTRTGRIVKPREIYSP